MSWISAAVAAVFVGGAALAAALVLRSRAKQKVQYFAMVLVLAGVLGVAVHRSVVPPLEARYEAGTVDESLSRNAAFA
ncbi:MAG TPA: hypothetical protein VHQ87_11245, partial [Rhizobacter sp.]|nr:hypothetical protein [Rhizobacter sp.]